MRLGPLNIEGPPAMKSFQPDPPEFFIEFICKRSVHQIRYESSLGFQFEDYVQQMLGETFAKKRIVLGSGGDLISD